MHLPASFHEPDAECAELLLLEVRLRLAQRHTLGLRIPALGDVPHALPAAAADDRDLSARAENFEHQSHLARAPPVVAVGALPAHVRVDLAREQRPALLELAQDVAAEGAVLVDELEPAPRPPPHAR